MLSLEHKVTPLQSKEDIMSQAALAFARRTAHIEGFAAPWSKGAAAYPQADTFEAVREAYKRARKPIMVKMSNAGEAGQHECAGCGLKLNAAYPANPDTEPEHYRPAEERSTWTYDPAAKGFRGGMHYYCSWGALMTRILEIRL